MKTRRNKEVDTQTTLIPLTRNSLEYNTLYYIDRAKLRSYSLVIDSVSYATLNISMCKGTFTLYVHAMDADTGDEIDDYIENVVAINALSSSPWVCELTIKTSDGVEYRDFEEIDVISVDDYTDDYIAFIDEYLGIFRFCSAIFTKPAFRGLACCGSFGAIDYNIDAQTSVTLMSLPKIAFHSSTWVLINNKHVFDFKGVCVTNVKPSASSRTAYFRLSKTRTKAYTLYVFYLKDGEWKFVTPIPLFTNASSIPFTVTACTTNFAIVGFDYIDVPADKAIIESATVSYDMQQHKTIPTEDGETFAKEQEGVACSLTQRLSLIQGELWYNITQGLPLFENVTSATTLDAWVIETIMAHPDVTDITSFYSASKNHKYSCDVVVATIYGEISLSI